MQMHVVGAFDRNCAEIADAVVDFHIGRDVAPVAIEQEHYVVDLAGGDDADNVFGQLLVGSDISYSGNAYGENPMFGGFLGFLLALLDKEGGYFFAPTVFFANALGNVNISRGAIGRLVFEGLSLLIEVLLGELPTDTVILFHFAGESAFLVFLFKDYRATIEVVISDDGIVATAVDVTMGVDGSGKEGVRLGDGAVLVGVEDLDADIVEGEATVLEHSCAEALFCGVAGIFPGLLVADLFTRRL